MITNIKEDEGEEILSEIRYDKVKEKKIEEESLRTMVFVIDKYIQTIDELWGKEEGREYLMSLDSYVRGLKEMVNLKF